MINYIFDFDDTLFNTKKFKKTIWALLISFNIKKEDIDLSYKKIYKEKNYNLESHLKEIKEKYPNIKEKEILKKLYKLSLKKYVLIHAEEVLKKLKNNKNINLILITKGNKKYQKYKLKKTNLEKYFKKNNIYITENNKLEIIKKIKKHKTYFINDKKEENDEIKKKFPDFIYILSSEKSIKKLTK